MASGGGMEVEVRVVGGARSCFVALPLHLIQALSRTSATGDLPPVLALDLRSPARARWSLAWSGAASRSRAIEVAQELAECISLPDGTIAQLSVARSLTRADSVSIEPFSEDDWEILESRADLAEETILQQVGIVYEGMKFPLWLDGHNIVKFVVVSSTPKKSVVQLVPGTEVAVAPKKRKEKYKDVQKQSSLNEQVQTKALLRVQAADNKYAHKFKYKGIELGVVLSCAVLIHPDTAARTSLGNLQLVTISSKSSPKGIQKGKEGAQKKGVLAPKERDQEMAVYVLFSDTVAKGHVMLPPSLRHFISADTHSWVYVKTCSANVKKDEPVITISPLRFNKHGKDEHDNSDLGSQEMDTWRKTRIHSENGDSFQDARNSEDILSAAVNSTSESMSEQKVLIKHWLIGQLKEMGLHAETSEMSSVVLPAKVLIHFEVVDQKQNRGVEFLYLLTIAFENSGYNNSQENVEISWNARTDDLENLELNFGKVELGEAISVDSIMDDGFNNASKLTQCSLGWMETAISDVTKRLSVLLSSTALSLFNRIKFPFPGHVLVHGPRGSGKTALIRTAAKYFEDHKEILAHIVYMDCSKLALGKAKEARQTIEDSISEALLHSPSVIIFDDLDNVISVSSDPQVSQSSSSSDSLVRYFADIMDEYKDKTQNSCGYGPIALMASVQSLQSLPQELTSSGRFDFHIELRALAIPEREALLKHHVEVHELHCSEEVLSEVASKCDGYDAYDLEILVDRAVHAAASRFVLPSAYLNSMKPTLMKEDFLRALHDFLPVAMRDLSKYAPDGNDGGWEDVGGLNEAVTIIKETLELPSKYPNVFTKAPVRLRSNILLYGPPGCGKTHIVRAAAAACSLRFISVKGPELLNKYIGSSEQSAAAAAPCLLFFDEFDSIAPQRGTHSAGVSDRVVNQFLTELDGVETLTGVFVFAATSKPQLIDAALLRPGRFDRLVFCDFPRWDERLEILKVHSRTVSLAEDAILEDVASLTEGFTGADLAAILTDAGLAAVHEVLDNSRETGVPEREPCISKELLMSVAMKARPSTPADDKRGYDKEFGEFVSSRKSISTKARESKGKKVTLA
ncbi:peroxisome biogenesis protein 1 isoform X2 [Brachypodium distachyon]|uniref:peroxisome biogenesis protein 1 isoform X2 n=1 Tax=Brachypodium distachyon TaxID=15368 RepID=UPI0001C7462D|nr:peroxisome biogenesis protein 1 isoform X2 [Brachypodium distachyon]|eukprot:XP_024316526.1 peroxisome biogenesis protein 1 isoform X2 [Brachypodium distachyon]